MSDIGYVYLITYAETPGYYKIGKALDLNKRLATLEVGSPFKISLVHSVSTRDTAELENRLHKKFSGCRVKGEWFWLSAEDVSYIQSIESIEQVVLPPKITPSTQVTPRESSNDLIRILKSMSPDLEQCFDGTGYSLLKGVAQGMAHLSDDDLIALREGLIR